jgi:hypothetical protein
MTLDDEEALVPGLAAPMGHWELCEAGTMESEERVRLHWGRRREVVTLSIAT